MMDDRVTDVPDELQLWAVNSRVHAIESWIVSRYPDAKEPLEQAFMEKMQEGIDKLRENLLYRGVKRIRIRNEP